MKKILLAVTLVAMVFTILPSCKKSKVEGEPVLTIETSPANKSNNLNILGPDFPLKVEITSAMPLSGVKITVTAVAEGSSASFFSATNNSSAPQNNYTITNTPDGAVCVVSITVASITTPSNSWSGTYRYSKK